MATHEELVHQITLGCRAVFDAHLARAQVQSRVGAAEKVTIKRLILALDRARTAAELPTPPAAADTDAGSTTAIPAWLDAFAPELPDVDTDADDDTSPVPHALPHPGNLRMLENLHRFQTGITRARLRLMRAGEDFDRAAYRAGRNAYTLAYAAYKVRLVREEAWASPEQNQTFEDVHLAGLREVGGADFPAHLLAAAAFVRDCIFGIAIS